MRWPETSAVANNGLETKMPSVCVGKIKKGENMRQMKRMCFLVFAGLLFVAGCSSTPKTAKVTPIQNLGAPEWVLSGSGAFGGEKGKVFYGVSSASNIQNASLLRTSADNRARNEVAKVFQVYTASLSKDYMSSTSAGANASTEEQHVNNALKTVTAMTLSGVEIVGHWQHPETGEFFALARVDLEAFRDNLAKAKELDARVREHIQKNAERLHDELEKEEAKTRQAGN